MIKLIIFDLDGTLLNTIDDISDALNYALEKNGFARKEVSEVKYLVGSGVDVLIKRATSESDLFLKVKDDYINKYIECQKNKTTLYDGILDTLDYIKFLGIKIAVLSNKPHMDTINIIDYYFPKDYFDYVMGKKDNNRIKPYSDGIEEIKNALKIYDNILYVGDTDIDIQTAINANLPSVAVSWGFRKEEELQNATYIIDNPLELQKIVLRMYDGVIIVDKPEGITSQTLLTKIKKILKVQKIGHAGTLDPLATGVMVVLLNQATKLSDYLMSNSKEYICDIIIGAAYDTEDISGTKEDEKKVDINQFNCDEIDNVLLSFMGKSFQIPPMYSSIKVQGKKMYEYAREGKTIEREERQIEVFDIQRISPLYYTNNELHFKFKTKVSKGTYIRSLCVAIGKKLNFPATMKGLCRSKSGIFDISDAVKMEQIANFDFKVHKMVDVLGDYNLVEIDDNMKRRITNGMKIYGDFLSSTVFFVQKGNLIGVYEKHDNNEYKARRVWN